MKFLIILGMAAMALAQNPLLPMTPYSFGYQTVDGMTRSESGSGNTVQGQYSYTDANGDLRTVKYIADANGFRPMGDISVDKKTAIEAAALAAQAPKAAPIAPQPQQWSNQPAFQSFNSWEQPKPVPAWNAQPAPAWNAQASFASATNYKVETPTHKIWVNY